MRTHASGRTSRGDVQPDESWQPSVGDTGRECVVDAIGIALACAAHAKDLAGSRLLSNTVGEEGRHEHRVSSYVADCGRHTGHWRALHAGGWTLAGEPGQR